MGEDVSIFSLTGYPEVLMFVYSDNACNFDITTDNICILVMVGLLCADAGDIDLSNNQRDWVLLNAVLLQMFLFKEDILY